MIPGQAAGASTTDKMTKVKTEPSLDTKPPAKLLEAMKKGSASHHRSAHSSGPDPYIYKLRSLTKAIKDTIFMNGTICDEVLRTEEKLAKAKEERRFLLRKLLQYQNISESTFPTPKAESHASGSSKKASGSSHSTPQQTESGSTDTPTPTPSKPAKGTKRKHAGGTSSTPGGGPATSGSEPKKRGAASAKDLLDTAQQPSRPTKKGKGVNRKVIPPLMLDSLGRPVFPMALGDVTLHSIGEILPDRQKFHCPESIYPAGYCITRVYASLNKMDAKCLYTCKISENDDGPLFEIAAEDNSEVLFKGQTPTDCHNLLLRAINKVRGDQLPLEGKGLDFFGLSHPVIQNLVQSCPGARKCAGYKWVRFEINKMETNDNVAVGRTDPAVSYDAFRALLGQGAGIPADPSTNLRSLLIKGSSHRT